MENKNENSNPNVNLQTPSMTIVRCKFCNKEFKSLIIDKAHASLDVTQRLVTHVNERHNEEALRYVARLQIISLNVPTILLYSTIGEIQPESTYMLEQINLARQLIFEYFKDNKWESVELQVNQPSKVNPVMRMR